MTPKELEMMLPNEFASKNKILNCPKQKGKKLEGQSVYL
jgi:hypothetical protein